jgi:hypothetical protein
VGQDEASKAQPRFIHKRCVPFARRQKRDTNSRQLTTGQDIEDRKRKGLIKTLVILFFLSLTFSTLSEVDESWEGLFLLYNFPGFIVYVISTGDIHGWKPGPIGQAGRVVVTALGSWTFWSLLAFAIYKAKKIRRQI